MKNNYSWETEDENDWELAPTAEQLPPRKSTHAFIFLVVGIAAACLLILFILNRRLEGREEIVRQNVIAAQRTWEQAVARRDLELFSTLISREHADWYQSQRRLLMSGRVLNRESFGLEHLPDESDYLDVAVESNWREAQLRFSQRYRVAGREEAGLITLLQTQTYEIVGNRWQLAQPQDSFWGDDISEQTGLVSVSYPERDADIIKRISADLAGDMAAICAQYEAAPECDPDSRILIRFTTDPESILALGDKNSPVLNGRTIVMPTPSLVGLPTDELAYHALYDGYTERIRLMLQNNLALPLPFPDQDIVTLCFPAFDQGLSLFAYNPQTDQWSEQSDARRFSFVQALPNDSALVLRAGFPGIEIAHLELVLRRQGQELRLFKEGTTEQSARFNGILDLPKNDSLLLSRVQGSTGIIDYRILPLESCADGTCEVNALEGFPLWSPGGDKTLILDGSELYIGGGNGEPEVLVGRAFSPFWLTDDTFGFVRLLGGSMDESPDMELVLRSVSSGQEQLLTKSANLLRQFDTNNTGAFRILFITASPKDPNLLFLAGTPVSGEGGRFFVIKIQLEGSTDPLESLVEISRVEVILTLDDLPVGDPTTLTPTGYPPFVITPDGRRLMVVRFADPVTNTWVLYLYNIEERQTKVITLNYPEYPAPFPFYDWSADGNWMLLVDNGYLRLSAPDYDYERIVPHDFAACRYPAWVNRTALTTELQ